MINEKQHIVKNFKSLRALVVGDAILDSYLHGATDRICREAPVPVFNASKEVNYCGGAANTAINLSALGAQTAFFTVLGKDRNGQEIVRLLQENKVETGNILYSKTRKTICKQRVVASDNIILRIDEGSTNNIAKKIERELLQSIAGAIANFDLLILSDYGLGLITPSLITNLKPILSNASIPVFVDSRNLGRFKSLQPFAVKPNWEETTDLLKFQPKSGEARVQQVIQEKDRLLKITGARHVVVTLDTEGAVILQKDKDPCRISTTPRQTKNTIGAGDTFISALSLAATLQVPIENAAEIANAAAAVVVQKDATERCTNSQLSAWFNSIPKFVSDTDELLPLVADLRAAGKKIVFTNGCFDLIHKGHVNLLHKAKQAGDVLIVGVNTDESTRRLKGPERPVVTLQDRIAVLAALESVDFLIPFEEESPVEIIQIIKPNVFVKGADYTKESIPEFPVLEKMGSEIKIISSDPAFSTSNIIHKIHEMTE